MGRSNVGQEKVRVLQKNNTGTYTVSLPLEFVRALEWQSGQKVVVEKTGKSVVIKDWVKK